MTLEKLKSTLLKLLFPDYDELTLFLHSMVTIIFVISSSGSLVFLVQLMFRQDSFFHVVLSIFILIVVLAIIILPIYHAFSKRKKRKWEKKIMLYAVVLMDYLVAWNVYVHLKGLLSGWELAFPLINAVQASLVILGLWFGFFTYEKVRDEDPESAEIIISSIMVILFFIIFHFILHQYWAVTFSVCIFYATIVNKIIIVAYRAIKKVINR